MIREVLRTCSNAHVAGAALTSIGGEFARQFADEAQRREVSAGALAADLVRTFSASASADQWAGAAEATRGADQPILAGLRHILTQGSIPTPSHNDR